MTLDRCIAAGGHSLEATRTYCVACGWTRPPPAPAPTGPSHLSFLEEGGFVPCRCAKGYDHQRADTPKTPTDVERDRERPLDRLLGLAEAVTSDAERWAVIRSAWATYVERGAGEFDWDYDSRDLMEALSGLKD